MHTVIDSSRRKCPFCHRELLINEGNHHCEQRQVAAERGEPSDCKTFAEVTSPERRTPSCLVSISLESAVYCLKLGNAQSFFLGEVNSE